MKNRERRTRALAKLKSIETEIALILRYFPDFRPQRQGVGRTAAPRHVARRLRGKGTARGVKVH